MKDSFKDKVIIITGASSGIGEELALQLAMEGAKLVLASRSEDLLKSVAEACEKLGGKALVVVTDVSVKEQCKNLIDKTVEFFGQIDVLVNNAGYTMWTKFEDIKNISAFEQLFKVKVFGSMYCTHFALPFLKKTKGRIIGVSSLTGKIATPTRTVYSSSNYAMAGFFDALRAEVCEHGISVTMVYPDFVATKIRERALDSKGNAIGESHISESNIMSVEKCVSMIIETTRKRKREVVMTYSGIAGIWLKMILPDMIDSIARKKVGFDKINEK